jgi:hypothetical protein
MVGSVNAVFPASGAAILNEANRYAEAKRDQGLDQSTRAVDAGDEQRGSGDLPYREQRQVNRQARPPSGSP